MTTILIWLGSGFAFSCGVFIGIFIFAYRNKEIAQATRDSTAEAKRAHVTLEERNRIGERQAAALEQLVGLITEAMDNASDDDPAEVDMNKEGI